MKEKITGASTLVEGADGGDSVVKRGKVFSKVVSITYKKMLIVQRLTNIDDGELRWESQGT